MIRMIQGLRKVWQSVPEHCVLRRHCGEGHHALGRPATSIVSMSAYILQCIFCQKDQTLKRGEIHQIYTEIKPSDQQPNCHGPKHLIVSACKISQNFTVVPLSEFDCWPPWTGPDANMAWPGQPLVYCSRKLAAIETLERRRADKV